ncbi:MAG: phosphate ABC transporter permease PstA [Planctomycetes bacterium]|jgi:phosphate transport system permease protein|nr:phosphate ABC transporter permease PstA [Planctomycetota bacterium]
MKLRFRGQLDRVFTIATGLSVVLLTLVLLAILGPMVYRGSSAVFFQGTVEFRKMQKNLFGRGDEQALHAEVAETEKVRQQVYEMIDAFKKGVDVEALSEQVRQIHRQFGQDLRDRNLPAGEYTRLRELTRQIRDKLEAAFRSQDINEIKRLVGEVLKDESNPQLKGTSAEKLFAIARQFLQAAGQIDLGKHQEYALALQEAEGILFHSEALPGLLGPRPGEPPAPLVMLRYGATRWDQAQTLLDRFLWVEHWVEEKPGEPLVLQRKPRAELFPEPLRPLFTYVEQNAGKMLHPRRTVYWQFLRDDNVNSHYFGGIGPEILGTMLITVVGMLFVIPLGIISAAYLVECASDGWTMRIIRMGINTLAGVPSIVFGLFGLAFFVLFLFPLLGFAPRPCILAASMTLAVLTLPVMIRASEEAIRSVPATYKEGSLALGASRFHTFIAVTFPAALPGILTGVILSLSRIAGETAPILFTGAVSLGAVPRSLFDPTRTLSYGSYDMAVGDRLGMMVPHNQYGMVVTLVLLILILNGAAIMLRTRVFKKLRGH